LPQSDQPSLSQISFDRRYFDGSCCRLSVVELGSKSKPDMLLVHGMRDHALSMLSIAEHFLADYHIYSLDLRGHGFSENTGSYPMTQFVADIAALIKEFELHQPVIVAHSLGGHILSRYSAIYPDQVSKLVLLDGMGPPGMGAAIPDENFREYLQYDVESALSLKSEGRRMANKAEALSRLLENNPRLGHAKAELIIEYGVEAHLDGGIKWRWDPRMNMVWSTFPRSEMEKIWRMITCPVLIVTGDESPEYWSLILGAEDQDIEFYNSEMTRRIDLFKFARHEVIKGAGHMLHYDQPASLNLAISDFLGE